MGTPTTPDDEFIRLVLEIGVARASKVLGVDTSAAFKRRRRLEKRLGIKIVAPGKIAKRIPRTAHPERANYTLADGKIIIGSDAHYWPGPASTAHRGMVMACKEFNPSIIIANGDMFDGAKISRFPPIGWQTVPTVVQEIEACNERLQELIDAAPNATRIWPLGNHDARFETRLATVANEFAAMKGFHLQDHFPEWEPCWSCMINDEIFIKHKWKGGTHAAFNNIKESGMSMVTGHLHKGTISNFTDLRGTRYGVDLPALADVWGPQFRDYTEDNPRNQRSGFAVLTIKDGLLLQPQLALVVGENQIEYAGKVYNV